MTLIKLLEEIRDWSVLSEALVKQNMASRYNKKVMPRVFTHEDLVVRRVYVGCKDTLGWKLAPNWERPY